MPFGLLILWNPDIGQKARESVVANVASTYQGDPTVARSASRRPTAPAGPRPDIGKCSKGRLHIDRLQLNLAFVNLLAAEVETAWRTSVLS